MIPIAIRSEVERVSSQVGIDPLLALALAGQESQYDATKTRYEPKWQRFVTPHYFALKLGITVDTEQILQSISWGAMQVMGAVARELSYSGQLSLLIQPELGILFGCRKIKSLSLKYSNQIDVISAYNAGTPQKFSGIYGNATYVNEVLTRLKSLQTGGE